MLRFLAKKPSLGIEITDSAVLVAAVSGRGGGITVEYAARRDLPAGVVAGSYASANINEQRGVVNALRECLSGSSLPYRRAALSLPDNVFRVQMLDFDALPAKPADRKRLISWRLEKSAAYDLTDTVLRYQVLRRQGSGFTVLACVAKRDVITQYETVLMEAGLEPWTVGVSSFHILNFYFPLMSKKSPSFAITHLTGDSFTTMVAETGVTRFYRFKDMKRVSAEEMKARFIREIEDSLHFYFTQRDRTQTTDVQSLYLTGTTSLPRDLAEGLGTSTSLRVEVLSPDDVIAQSGVRRARLSPAASAALGAGSAL
jgi:Tfp pilus assembly PilM family ATPase